MTTSDSKEASTQEKQVSSWKKDKRGIFLLFLISIVQAIPHGLFLVTIPICLIEKGASYDDLRILFLSYIPLCFKCFISPILNTCYLKSFGRGKTYLVPAYYILTIIMIFMSFQGDKLLELHSIPMLSGLAVFTMCILTLSDITFDTWVVNLLSKENSSYGAVCQNIGGNLGIFMTFNLLVPLSSLDFCNKHIYSSPQKVPVLQLNSYILALGVFIFIVAAYIHLFVTEKEPEAEAKSADSVKEVLKTMSIFLHNSHFRKLLILFSTWNLIFGPIHNLFGTIILQKGLSKEMFTNLNTPMPIILFFFTMWLGTQCRTRPETKVATGFWIIRLLSTFVLYGTMIYYEVIPEVIKTPLLFICLLLGALTFNGIGVALGALASRIAKDTFGGPILSTFGAIGAFGRLLADFFALYSLKITSWDNLAIGSLVGMFFYAVFFVKELKYFENKDFKQLATAKLKED